MSVANYYFQHTFASARSAGSEGRARQRGRQTLDVRARGRGPAVVDAEDCAAVGRLSTCGRISLWLRGRRPGAPGESHSHSGAGTTSRHRRSGSLRGRRSRTLGGRSGLSGTRCGAGHAAGHFDWRAGARTGVLTGDRAARGRATGRCSGGGSDGWPGAGRDGRARGRRAAGRGRRLAAPARRSRILTGRRLLAGRTRRARGGVAAAAHLGTVLLVDVGILASLL